MKAIILAAGVGSRLAPLTDDRPKPLVEVGGKSLLLRMLERLAAVGITGKDVIVVGGYRMDVLAASLEAAGQAVTLVRNPRFDTWNNFYSIAVAREAVAGDGFVQLDGDVLFDGKVLPRLLAAPGPGALAVDVRTELDPETMKVMAAGGRVTAMAKTLDPAGCLGEYIGILRVDAAFAPEVFAELALFPGEGLTHEYYDHAYHRLAARGRGPLNVVDIHDCQTIEIDDRADLDRAGRLLAVQDG